MTLSEFKAWFEGYTEGLEAAPTKAQFDRIKEKVREIDGTVTSYPIYIDRYVNPWRGHWDRYWSGATGGVGASWGASNASKAVGGDLMYGSNAMLAPKGDAITESFDPLAAMYAAGRAEAQMAA